MPWDEKNIAGATNSHSIRKFPTFATNGSVVQWIEYQIPVLRVEGSSPSGVTGSGAKCEM